MSRLPGDRALQAVPGSTPQTLAIVVTTPSRRSRRSVADPVKQHHLGMAPEQNLDDERLAERWEAGDRFADGISHEEHVRIAWVLLRRYGRTVGGQRLLDGTRRACEAHGVPEKFDEELTRRWTDVIARAMDSTPDVESSGELLARHPQLRDGDLPS